MADEPSLDAIEPDSIVSEDELAAMAEGAEQAEVDADDDDEVELQPLQAEGDDGLDALEADEQDEDAVEFEPLEAQGHGDLDDLDNLAIGDDEDDFDSMDDFPGEDTAPAGGDVKAAVAESDGEGAGAIPMDFEMEGEPAAVEDADVGEALGQAIADLTQASDGSEADDDQWALEDDDEVLPDDDLAAVGQSELPDPFDGGGDGFDALPDGKADLWSSSALERPKVPDAEPQLPPANDRQQIESELAELDLELARLDTELVPRNGRSGSTPGVIEPHGQEGQAALSKASQDDSWAGESIPGFSTAMMQSISEAAVEREEKSVDDNAESENSAWEEDPWDMVELSGQSVDIPLQEQFDSSGSEQRDSSGQPPVSTGPMFDPPGHPVIALDEAIETPEGLLSLQTADLAPGEPSIRVSVYRGGRLLVWRDHSYGDLLSEERRAVEPSRVPERVEDLHAQVRDRLRSGGIAKLGWTTHGVEDM
jgi:hypothetical protein